MSGGGVLPPGFGGPGNWSDGNASGSRAGNWNAGDVSGGGVWPPGVGGPGNWSDGNASGSGPGVGPPGNWSAVHSSTTGYDDKTPITTQPVASASKGIEEKRVLKISFLVNLFTRFIQSLNVCGFLCMRVKVPHEPCKIYHGKGSCTHQITSCVLVVMS